MPEEYQKDTQNSSKDKFVALLINNHVSIKIKQNIEYLEEAFSSC